MERDLSAIPVYRFGSASLAALHDAARDPAYRVATRGAGWQFSGNAWYARESFAAYRQEYSWSHNGYEYIVDHGGFRTLNRIVRGQVVPVSEFI